MTSEQIEQLIRELLKTGEILATKAFELAVKQIYTYAIMDLIVGIPMFLIGIWIWRYCIKNYKATREFNIYDLGYFMSFLMCLIGISTSLSSIRFFLNPEWYAIKLLLETFLR